MSQRQPWAAWALVLGLLAAAPARAAELYAGDGVSIRWDNTLRYSAGVRLGSPDPLLLSYPNSDDGDRNFAAGLMSNRLDLLSVLDLTGDTVGLQLSVAAWYDTVYHSRTDNRSTASLNTVSVPAGQVARATRDIDGGYAELADSFVYGNFALAGMPLSVRVGRQTLLWGESLFYSDNGIAAAQAPVDYVKSTATPDSYSRNSFLPVNQVSLTLQPAADLSLAAYYQLEWRPSRLPGVGSYFSTSDLQGVGSEQAFAGARILEHGRDDRPPGDGQFGVSLHKSFDDVDLGLYVLRFDAKDPVLGVDSYGAGQTGYFRSLYPGGIDLYGLSFSTYAGDSTIAGEISARRHMPLLSTSPISLYVSAPVRSFPGSGYAEGDTLHAQVSDVTTLGPSPAWDSADFSIEFAANELLAVTADPQALATRRDDFAASGRFLLQPHYFQVLANLDVTPQLGLGYNITGRSSTDYRQVGGTGDAEIGVSVTYLSVWKLDLTLTTFIGAPSRQFLADRDFVMLGLERTF